ncbi:hypothetical protein ANN_24603 [Periplaneta americana]|uniref:Uncharacterized protein n=1 Tax=Periplaneta americana TaxID=6978 RepID=A0ABQ8S3G3_PERAM|nr:hypothetical protein ANN_24603 [Periplaneta americana]
MAGLCEAGNESPGSLKVICKYLYIYNTHIHNAQLHALYSSPDIIRTITSRRLRWAGHVTRMGESRNAYKVLLGRPEGKRPLERPRRRWEDNIEMDLREVGYDGRDWINLAQDRDQWRPYVRAPMNLRVPQKPLMTPKKRDMSIAYVLMGVGRQWRLELRSLKRNRSPKCCEDIKTKSKSGRPKNFPKKAKKITMANSGKKRRSNSAVDKEIKQKRFKTCEL